MPDRPRWIRSVLSLLAVVGIGAVGLAGVAWLTVQLLPDGSDEVEPDLSAEESAGESVELVETVAIGAVDTDAHRRPTPTCQVDRLALADALTPGCPQTAESPVLGPPACCEAQTGGPRTVGRA